MSEVFLYSTNKSQETSLNVWCAFPAVYNFGMSSLGFLTVFKHIDSIDGIFVERIFTDTEKTVLIPQNVDVLSFSVSFELDFLGILSILEKYKIPFLAKDREENHPWIYGGGPVLSSNPEPFAEFFDFIMIGDAELTINQVFDTLKNNKTKTRTQKLELLSKIDGIYIPSLKTPDYKVKKVTSNHNFCTSTPILTENSFFSNTFIIEIERGCPCSCAFCMTSFINHPVRYFDYEDIIKQIDLGLKYTNKLALLGALICAHPRIDDICQYIIDKVDSGMNIEVSVSSLRANYVSDKTLEMLHKCGQRTATIAVEAGSDRLRKVINKNITNENIINIAEKMHAFGFSGLKMYGIIGLPTETYEDLDAFVELCKTIKNRCRGFNLIPSFSTFVPKAHTPFQFAKKEDTKTLEKKNEYIKKQFAKIGIKARTSSAKWDYIQALLSRGSRKLTPFLIEIYKDGGSIGSFKKVFKEANFNTDYIALNEFNKSDVCWNFIEYPKNIEDLQVCYNKLLN